MTKFWHIAWHEYSRHVFRRRFIFALLSVPFLIAVMVVLILVVIWMDSDPTPIGYVDGSGLLADPLPQPPVKWPEQTVPMMAYPDKASAEADLQAGKLQAYYILPENYLQTGQVEQVYNKEPKGINIGQFNDFLVVNVFRNQPEEVARRVIGGSTLVIKTTDQAVKTPEDSLLNLILPFFSGIMFIIAMSTSSGYLMQAVVEEKENRTMEIVVTSVSPGQLMSGKIIGDIAVGVTQLVVWTFFFILFLTFGRSYIPFLSGLKFSGEMVGVLLAVMVPAYVMISGLMAAIGATVTESTEGQQVVGLFTIPIWLPYILISTFFQNPNSPLAIAMSLFPLTAPMTIAMRLGITSIPAWQIIAGVIILVLSAVGSLWLAGRAFRLGMLRYGRRLRWKEIFSRQGV
jgi:ABC-2 type transport system permease protein